MIKLFWLNTQSCQRVFSVFSRKLGELKIVCLTARPSVLCFVLVVHIQNYFFWFVGHAPGNAVLKAISWKGCGFLISCPSSSTHSPRSPSLQVMTLLFESAKMLNTLSAQLLLFPALSLRWRDCISPACECCSHVFLALWGFFWVLINLLNAFLQGILSLEKKQGKQRLCSEGMHIKV